MTSSIPPDARPPLASSDEFDLRAIVGPIWRHRSLLLVLGLMGAAAGAGFSLLSTRYLSDGLLQTPGITTDTYKRHEDGFLNVARLQAFRGQHTDAPQNALALIDRLIADPGRLRTTITPEFAFTEEDQRAFGVRPTSGDPGALVGVRIRLTEGIPTGPAPLLLLGEYVRDTTIRVDLETRLLANCQQFSLREQTLKNEQITSDFEIRQEESRVQTLRSIVARTPGAARDNLGILSVESGSERFLSPLAQLVAAEVLIADLRLAATERARERVAGALKRDYYCRAEQALASAPSGRRFLDGLSTVLTAVFAGHDRTVDVVEHTWNELEIQLVGWRDLFLTNTRFAAAPDGSEEVTREPGLLEGMVLGAVAGLVLGAFVAFVRFWWGNNRMQITAQDAS